MNLNIWKIKSKSWSKLLKKNKLFSTIMWSKESDSTRKSSKSLKPKKFPEIVIKKVSIERKQNGIKWNLLKKTILRSRGGTKCLGSYSFPTLTIRINDYVNLYYWRWLKKLYCYWLKLFESFPRTHSLIVGISSNQIRLII